MMRRKSERNKGKSPENKVEKPKRGRPPRRRKKSSSSSPDRVSESGEIVPVNQEVDTIELQTTSTSTLPAQEVTVASDDDDVEQVWHVKASESSGETGEIQKLKICLSRPSSTPERPDRSPRGRKKLNRTSTQLEFSPESSEDKRKSRHRTRRGSTKETTNTDDNMSSDNTEKEVTPKNEVHVSLEKSMSPQSLTEKKLAASPEHNDVEPIVLKDVESLKPTDCVSQLPSKEHEVDLTKQETSKKISGDEDSKFPIKNKEGSSECHQDTNGSKSSTSSLEEVTTSDNSKQVNTSPNLISKEIKEATHSGNKKQPRISPELTIKEVKDILSSDKTKTENILQEKLPQEVVKESFSKEMSESLEQIKESVTLVPTVESNKDTSNAIVMVKEIDNSSSYNILPETKPIDSEISHKPTQTAKLASESTQKDVHGSLSPVNVETLSDKPEAVEMAVSNEEFVVSKDKEVKETQMETEISPIQSEKSTSVNNVILSVSTINDSPPPVTVANDVQLNSVKDLTVEGKEIPVVAVTPTESVTIGSVRKRKWGSRSAKTSIVSISTDSLKNLISHVEPVSVEDVLLDIKPKDSIEIKSDNKKFAEDERNSNEKYSIREKKKEKDILGSLTHRKISIVNEEVPKEQRPPSPPKYKSSAILYITNLVRPFTLPQLKNLLQRTGKLAENGFWIDKIKSRCYVQYQTEDEAIETRHALHGVTWPVSNPKTLNVDFGSAVDMREALASGEDDRPFNQPDTWHKEQYVRDNKISGKENDEKMFEKRTIVREWDVGKGDVLDGRQQQRGAGLGGGHTDPPERRKRRSKSPSPARKFKKKEEEAPSKLLDDLFKKTKATPCIYWLPLNADIILIKEEQRRKHMAEHERRMEELRRAAEQDQRPRNPAHHSSNHRHR